MQGADDVSVRFSKCCSPIPGDEIVGYVTRGRGVSIHRTDCVNILALPEDERARLIPAEWEEEDNNTTHEHYVAEIKIFTNDRPGLLVDISKVLTEKNISILSMNVRTSKQGTATADISFSTTGVSELTSLIEKLRQIPDVIDIQRSTG